MKIDIAKGILNIGNSIIERIFPNKEEREKAQLQLLNLQKEGELRQLEIQMSAIVMEAKSSDKWTSRARPGFLYVMYFMILLSVPMGFWHLFSPQTAELFSEGMKKWLGDIPPGLWGLFSAGYLGYSGARSYDKKNILKAR